MTKRSFVLAGVAVFLTYGEPLAGQQTASDSLHDRVAQRLASAEASLIELRRDIHRHPEVSGAEERTAGVVAARLEALGFDVRTGVGGHGVVGVLRGARSGPTVAFRADMDAVTSNVPDPVEFRSLTPGVRHICGHDVHTTIGIGIAVGLAAVREELSGTVMLVFQPAEERGTGAVAMLADGVFADVVPDAIYAVHTAPYPVGVLGTAPGGMMAGRDFVEVVVRGRGDLEAAADSARRAIQRAGNLPPHMAFQPAPPGFILTQVLQARRAAYGDGWIVHAQVTTASAESRARAKEGILEGLERLVLPGITLETTYRDRAIAGVTNDSTLVSRANASVRAVLGDSAVVLVEGVPPAFSEDFGSFQDEVTGVMYFLGVSNPVTGTVGMPHSPDYVADEAAILVGTKAMTAVLLDWLVANQTDR